MLILRAACPCPNLKHSLVFYVGCVFPSLDKFERLIGNLVLTEVAHPLQDWYTVLVYYDEASANSAMELRYIRIPR